MFETIVLNMVIDYVVRLLAQRILMSRNNYFRTYY